MRKLLSWIDEQTGLVSAIHHFMLEPLPERVGWPHIFGSLVMFFFTVQVATGIMLMVYYSPSPDHAYETVQYITYKLPFGGLVRGLHHWAAGGMMVALGLHLIQVFLWGAYKRPRQIIWVIGIGLMLTTLGFSFTGYLLPWDQKAYWATVVGTNIAGAVPFIGELIREVLRGGSTVGAITLTRFFAIHVGILPPIISVLIVFHVLQVRKKGITPPWRRVSDEGDVRHPQFFWPHQVLKDAVAALFVLAVVFVLAIKFGAPIEPLANPADTAYVPRPEWYFLWMFEMLKYFPGELEFVGAVLLPGIAVALLTIYPYLDRNPERRIGKRRYAIGLCVVTFLGVSYLGVHAVLSAPKEEKLTAVEQQGQKLFMDLRCHSCHGINGGGGNAGPDLAQSGPFDEKQLEALLRDPAQFRPRSIMPPADVSKREMHALVSYLTAIKPTSRLPIEPQAGPRKPPSHFEELWYINHKFEVRKDPSQCQKCHEPEFCQTCHSKRRPDSHLNDWLKAHFGTAREKPEYCRVCHEESFCTSCHENFLHTSDWLKARHAAAALKDPDMCGNCHQEVLCETCHRGAKPAMHTADWNVRHAGVARAGTGQCWMCHKQESCDACHGVRVPHGAGWMSEHGKIAIEQPGKCARCHTSGKRDCRNCHRGGLKPSFHTVSFMRDHSGRGGDHPTLCSLCHGRDSCNRCHRTGTVKPASHNQTWLKTHGGMARTSQKTCTLCHDKKDCIACHGVELPHPAGWAMGGHRNVGSFASGSKCYKCHERAYCFQCHEEPHS
ncbi:MAG: cytochrome b N-terminal domain-containing protein [Armatimonadetes bacterium]|nr:cytochrome b N-terminal domain-containing protein [Armatimonadota bacterium]